MPRSADLLLPLLVVMLLLGSCTDGGAGNSDQTSTSEAAQPTMSPSGELPTDRSPGNATPGDASPTASAGTEPTTANGDPVRDGTPHSSRLVDVTFGPAGDGLAVTFELEAPVYGDEPESVVWAVEFLEGSELVATVTAQRIGARLLAAVYDWESSEQEQLPVQAEGHHLVVEVPAGTGLDDRLAWRAVTQRDGADADRLPGNGEMMGYGTVRR